MPASAIYVNVIFFFIAILNLTLSVVNTICIEIIAQIPDNVHIFRNFKEPFELVE